MTTRIAILGSTGSVGRSALQLVDLHPDWFRPAVLVAHSNADLLYQQCLKYRPGMAALFDEEAAATLRTRLPDTRVLAGQAGVIEAACAPQTDVVLSAISGAAGLLPTYEALRQGKKVALANKETLVMAGDLIRPLLDDAPDRLLPVDSEHVALHQCLKGARRHEIDRLILTASGGPFRELSKSRLETVTPEQALRHPTWEMGPKITVDSATLMNKGLEVIEAHHLFDIPPDRIDVVIHPSSIVHSLVRFVDGSLLAQLSHADMKGAILYALTFPERRSARLPDLDLTRLPALEFHSPDLERFPCLSLAYAALEAGGTASAALNAANEIAVESFLAEALPFSAIPELIGEVLAGHSARAADSIETVVTADSQARRAARELLPRFVRQN